MAQKADGAIYIDTAIETDGFVAGSKELENAVCRMAKQVSGIGETARIALQKQTDMFVKQNQHVDQQKQKVDELKNKLKELESQHIETDSYKEVSSEIQKLESEFGTLKAKQDEWLDLGFKMDSAPLQNTQKELDAISVKIDNLRAKQKEMVSEGTAYTAPDTSAEEIKLAVAEQRLIQMQNALGTSYESLKVKTTSYTKKGITLEGVKKKLRNATEKLGASLKKAAFAMLGLNKQTKNTGMSMGKMLATSLLFSTVFRAFSAVTNAAKEGMQNLSKYSGSTNSSLSALMSSLTQLKNSFATAFSPILSVVAPILTTLINLISRAVTYAGMLIAVLSGKSSFVKAVPVQEDYAASLGDTASAAGDAADAMKEAEKANREYLSGLDEIQKFSKEDSGSSGGGGGGGGGGGAGDMFETVPIDSSISDMADKIKSVFEKIFTPFKEAWEKEGKETIDAAKYAFESLGKTAKSVGKSMMEVWTNGTGTEMLTTMLQIAHNVLNTVGHIANRFREAWETNEVGTRIIQGMADALQAVLNFVNQITASTMRWAAELDFYPLLESIANLFGSLSPLISTIGNVLNGVYQNIILPAATYLIETALPWIINKLSELFTFLSENQWILEVVGAAMVGMFAAGKIAPLVTTIIGFIQNIIGVLSGGGGLLSAIKGVVSTLGGPLTIAIAVAIAAGVLLWKNWDTIKEYAGKLAKWIGEKWEWIGEKTSEIWSNIAVFMSETWNNLTSWATEKFNSIITTISNVWKNLGTVTSTKWNNIRTTVLNLWKGLEKSASTVFESIRKTVSDIWDNMQTKASDAWNEIMTGITDIADGIKESVTDTFTKMRDTIKSIFDKIVGFVKAPINSAIDLVNSAIGKINGAIGGIESALSFGPWEIPIPEFLGGGSQTIGFSANFPRVKYIPQLATGAVIPPNAPFVAMLGDQRHGNNIEAPENLIRKIVREETQGQGFSREIRIPLILDGRKIYEAVVTQDQLSKAASGRSLLGLT